MAPRAGKNKSPPPTNAPPPAAGHNTGGPLTQDDMDDLQLIHMADLRKANDALEAAQEIVRGVRKTRTRLRTLVRTDGFPLAQLDEILKDELLPVREVREREEKRAHMRGVAGQPGGTTEPQVDLFKDTMAQKQADEAAYRGHGYTAGLRGLEQSPAKYDVPADMQQAWLEEWHRGQSRLAKAVLTKNRIEGVTQPQTAHPGGPGLSAADLANIGDANDNDATKPPAADANDAGETSGQPATASESLPGSSTSTPTEGFEATDEELAAQKTRQGIQEGRVGEAQPPATESSGDGASASELNAGSDTTPASPASSGTSSEEPEKPSIDEPCPLCGAEAGEACHEDCPGEEPAAA